MNVPHIAIVGSINVDVTTRVSRLPQPGETILSSALKRTAGGKGANQAAAVARLVGHSVMIGAVGNDADGDLVCKELAKAGVDVSGIRKLSGEPTGTAFIAVDEDGENNIIVHPGANLHAYPHAAELPAADALIVQFEIAFESVLRAVEKAPGYVVVNASPSRNVPESLLERADLFVVNESEYRQMPELQRAKRVVVTYGAEGSALFEHGQETVRVPAHSPRQLVSSVGAGDAFCASLVVAFLSGHSWEQALNTAAAVGAEAVSQEASQPLLEPLTHFEELAAQRHTA